MQPKIGPVLYSVREFVGLSVPALAGGVPGTSGVQTFRYPRSVFVTSIRLVTNDGSPASLAALSLRIQDETSQEVIFNVAGQNTAPFGALQGIGGIGGPGLLVRGAGKFELQRPVADGDTWLMTVRNSSGAPIVLAALLLEFAEGLRDAA